MTARPAADAGLETARAELRALEEPIVRALLERARFRRNTPAAAGPLSRLYAAEILPFLCAPGDDGRGEESAAVDERLLALLGERIGLGERVALAKARLHPELATLARTGGGRAELLRALTNAEVERQVLARVRALAERAGFPPEAHLVVEVFRRWIIPLTKEREAERLSGR